MAVRHLLKVTESWLQAAPFSQSPCIVLADDDYAAIYFSSGTTGFPKAILHKHQSLMQAAQMERGIA